MISSVSQTTGLAQALRAALEGLKNSAETAGPLVAKPIDPANVRPLSAADKEKIQRENPPREIARREVANWGLEGKLMAQGGQAEVDSFWSNLTAYLKTTNLNGPIVDPSNLLDKA